jgi:hypothetical protein
MFVELKAQADAEMLLRAFRKNLEDLTPLKKRFVLEDLPWVDYEHKSFCAVAFTLRGFEGMFLLEFTDWDDMVDTYQNVSVYRYQVVCDKEMYSEVYQRRPPHIPNIYYCDAGEGAAYVKPQGWTSNFQQPANAEDWPIEDFHSKLFEEVESELFTPLERAATHFWY